MEVTNLNTNLDEFEICFMVVDKSEDFNENGQ